MLQMTLWELRKIIENKFLWITLVIAIVVALFTPGPDQNHYLRLSIYEQYKGELSEQSDRIKSDYIEYKARIDACKKENLHKDKSTCEIDLFSNSDEYYTERVKFDALEEMVKSLKNTEKIKTYTDQSFVQFNRDLQDTDFGEQVMLDKYNKMREYDDLEGVYAPSSSFLENYHKNFSRSLFLILVCIFVGIMPVFMQEKQFKTRSLIISTKTGRFAFINKLVATLIFSTLIFLVIYGIHVYRFGINAGLGYYWENPLRTGANPKIDLTISEFILFQSIWGLLLILFSSIMILTLSKFSKRFLIGSIVAFIYLLIPLVHNYLSIKIDVPTTYVLNYLNIITAIRYSEYSFMLGISSYIEVPQYMFWTRDVLLFHSFSLIVTVTAVGYYTLRRENIN